MKTDLEFVSRKVDLGPRGPQASPDKMIELLHQMVTLAERGDLTGLAVVTTHADGHIGYGWAFTEERASGDMLGAFNLLQRRFLDEIYGGSLENAHRDGRSEK